MQTQTQICQSCGGLLRDARAFCTACGVHISQASTTGLGTLAFGARISTSSVQPDPQKLDVIIGQQRSGQTDRVVTSRVALELELAPSGVTGETKTKAVPVPTGDERSPDRPADVVFFPERTESKRDLLPASPFDSFAPKPATEIKPSIPEANPETHTQSKPNPFDFFASTPAQKMQIAEKTPQSKLVVKPADDTSVGVTGVQNTTTKEVCVPEPRKPADTSKTEAISSSVEGSAALKVSNGKLSAKQQKSKKQNKKPTFLSSTPVSLMAAVLGIAFLLSAIVSMVPALHGGMKNSTTAGTNLTGTWRIQAGEGQTWGLSSRVSIDQAGTSFDSPMSSDKFGGFVIAQGAINGSNIRFRKLYMSNHGGVRASITYTGIIDRMPKLDGISPLPRMHGIWAVDGAPQTHGLWAADMLKSGGSSRPPNGFGELLSRIIGFPTQQSEYLPFFGKIFFFFASIAVGLVYVSFRTFGPSGWLNIASKKEYIPSQYKKEWFKVLREYGKPLTRGGVPLGTRTDWSRLKFWTARNMYVPPSVRATNPHMLLLGSSGKGKSRLLANMIGHDIEANDRAVVVVDSDGSLIDLVLGWLAAHPQAKEISKRVSILDPTSKMETLTYNPLEFPQDGDVQSAAQAVVSGFKAIYTEPPGSQSQWNHQTANILRNSVILLMANGKTLADLPALLSDNDVRDVLLDNLSKIKDRKVEYKTLLEAWGQYKRLARTEQWINWVEPILNRVQPMLSDPRIQPIVTEIEGNLDLLDVIRERRILLLKLPKGRLEQSGNLLGSMVVSGLRQAALSLSYQDTHEFPCALYLDELPNFIEKDTYETITTETRKLQIGLVGACRTLQDLPEDFRGKLTGNAGAICVFSLAKKDADVLGPQMFRVDGRKVKVWTLQNLFNRPNTSPQYEQVIDEEKLNIDRIAGQDDRCYFYYKVGGQITVFHVRATEFATVSRSEGNWKVIDKIYARSGRQT